MTLVGGRKLIQVYQSQDSVAFIINNLYSSLVCEDACFLKKETIAPASYSGSPKFDQGAGTRKTCSATWACSMDGHPPCAPFAPLRFPNAHLKCRYIP